MLMSAELKGCVTRFIYFLDLFYVRYKCAKFHHCRQCVACVSHIFNCRWEREVWRMIFYYYTFPISRTICHLISQFFIFIVSNLRRNFWNFMKISHQALLVQIYGKEEPGSTTLGALIIRKLGRIGNAMLTNKFSFTKKKDNNNPLRRLFPFHLRRIIHWKIFNICTENIKWELW